MLQQTWLPFRGGGVFTFRYSSLATGKGDVDGTFIHLYSPLFIDA